MCVCVCVCVTVITYLQILGCGHVRPDVVDNFF